MVKAGERLRHAGFEIEQINTPGTTSSGALRLLAEAGATHAEPGNGLHGTTPLMNFDEAPEVPAVVYVSEVSHFDGDTPTFSARACTSTRCLASTVCARSADVTRASSIRSTQAERFHYYAVLHLPARHDVRVGDTVVFCFRPQVFVTRARARALFRNRDGTVRLGDTYDANDGRLVDGVASPIDRRKSKT